MNSFMFFVSQRLRVMLNFDNDDDDGQEALILGRLRMQRDPVQRKRETVQKMHLEQKKHVYTLQNDGFDR
jgi:hypothetical protein